MRTASTIDFPTDAPFYLAVEAVLRRHWGTVLAFNYNAAHRDHFHVQHGRPVGFVEWLRSDVLFVQGACLHILDLPVTLDGAWGPETRGALADAQRILEVPGTLDDVGTWKALLAAIARRGFDRGIDTTAPTPRDRLRDVHRVLLAELGDSEARKRIEAAVNAFAEHPEVREVLRRDGDPS